MQGYLVGNGVADEFFDGNALVPFAFGMGLISNDIFEVRSCSRKDLEIMRITQLEQISIHLSRTLT